MEDTGANKYYDKIKGDVTIIQPSKLSTIPKDPPGSITPPPTPPIAPYAIQPGPINVWVMLGILFLIRTSM